MGEWLTASAWAESLGISRQAAHAAIRRLSIEVVDGKVHGAKATAIYRAMTRQRVRVAKRQASTAEPAEHVTYDEARRREAVATAKMREREAALQAGTLILVDDLRNIFAKHLVAARNIALSVASRLAPVVAAESSIAVVHRLLDDEMNAMLAEMSGADADLAARQRAKG